METQTTVLSVVTSVKKQRKNTRENTKEKWFTSIKKEKSKWYGKTRVTSCELRVKSLKVH